MMPDREKVIKGLECCSFDCCRKEHGCPYYDAKYPGSCQIQLHKDALELLKEQEDLGTELTNAVELIHKKNQRIEKLMKEQEAVVRCKDCKHQNWVNAETGCIVCKLGRGTNAPDWFCADGERR